MAATIDDAIAAVSALKVSVDALIAKAGQPPVQVDLQPVVDAVNAVKAEVDAAVNPPSA